MLPAIPTLKKDTLEATYEHVNRLVKEESGENFDNVKEFIEYNDKLNVFEKKVQAIIVDSLKIKEGVINALLSDDIHLIRRVLKCDWFFEDSVTPDFYENSIFPNVSFSTRCKIINKLSRNIKSEQHAEQLFQFARHNYGSKYAEMLLPRCSSQFISAYITECKPLFHNNNSIKILINICKRFPKIVISFLETVFHKDYCHKNMRRKYAKLILYIARYHPVDFIPFFEKYYSELLFFNFGKKLTKTFATQLRNLVKNSSGQLLRGVVNQSVLFKCLTFDDQVEFLDSLVRAKNSKLTTNNWSLALPNIMPLMRLKAPSERVRLLETTFSKIYNQNFGDHPELWTLRFLELLPLEYRTYCVDILRKMKEEQIMDLRLHEECEDSERDIQDIFIYLLGCKSAFPVLTQLMNKMSTTARREILLKEMIKNSIINEDAEGLEMVFGYILKRHKNDDPRMILRLIENVHSLSSKMVNVNIWGLVEEMATIVLLTAKEHYMYKSVMEKYIRFRLANNLDARPQIKNMVNLNFVPCPYSMPLLENVRKPYSKEIIKLYYEEITSVLNITGTQDNVKEELLISLLRTINEYNAKSRRNRIDVKEFPVMLEEIDRLMGKAQHNADGSFLLRELTRDPVLRAKYATNLLQVSLLPNTLLHLLKLDPEYVVNSLDNILNDLFTIYGEFAFKKFITSRSRLDFLNITSNIEKITCEKFKTSVSCTRKVNALKMYSYFANIDDFAALVQEYIPIKERMFLDKNNGEFLTIQMTVPQVIKNIKPDSKNLPLISQYLNKDFLRWVLPSFNSACHNTPSRIILPILKEYFPAKSISVKKAILYRITDISVNEEKLKYFRALWDSEKHSSVRALVFQTISKCFIENPSTEIFEIVKKCISEADELTIKDRPSLSTIPAQYLNEYTILLWKFTERYENSRFTTNFRNDLIHHFVPMNIWILSEEFCEMIIRRYLFDSGAKVNVNNFSCYYLISNPYSMSQKLSVIMQLMRERRFNYFSVSSFLSLLCRLSVEDPKRFVGVFEGILEGWPNVYKSVKMFEEHLQLRIAKSYNKVMKSLDYQSDSPSLAAQFGRELRNTVSELPKYSCFIDIIKDTIKSFLGFLTDVDVPTVINNFLDRSFGQPEALLAVALLPEDMIDSFKKKQAGDYFHNAEVTEEFQTVFNKLKETDDEVVKVYLNRRLGNELD
ncbi:UNVERIFIED_CONTAM: hypothetical protein PYX00_008551 [Menopon gallinae]